MDNITRVTLGSTYRATWVSSGVTASPIVYNIFSGSETMVRSYAGVDSGNGHYYVDARIDSVGLWRGSWFATVSANSFRNDEVLAIFPFDTDQPGRYITWDDVVNRFTEFTDFGGAIKVASHHIVYAEAQLDSMLGTVFVVPFSSNNITIKDLAIDLVYARAIRGKSDEYKSIRADVASRVYALCNGLAYMITASGEILQQQNKYGWSSTQDYHPVFGLLDYEISPGASSAQLMDELAERGLQ